MPIAFFIFAIYWYARICCKKKEFLYKSAKRAEKIKEIIQLYNLTDINEGVIFKSTNMCMWIYIED